MRVFVKKSLSISKVKYWFIFSWQKVGNHYTSRRRLAEWALCSFAVWLRLVSYSTVKRFLSHVTINLQRVHFLVILDCYLLQLGVIRRCDYLVSVQVLLFCFRGMTSHCAHFKRNFNSLFQYFHDNFLSLVMRWYRLIDSADIFRVYFSFCCAGFATLGINSKYFKYSFNFVGVWILQVTVNLKSQKVKTDWQILQGKPSTSGEVKTWAKELSTYEAPTIPARHFAWTTSMPYDISVLNDSFEITQPMTLSKCS